ncbi:MAG: YbaB/EbfC family nucleoid-associated protein [Puniceicoccales bacterium]|jgi:DNA-binding protein YbaB|nr:YbaB/EbfC family nucleoid-associated protein [Puniceicoccales bacterium]
MGKNNERMIMEDMEKLLKSMTQMKDGMEAMQSELIAYTESHDEGGVHVEVQGDGIIKNLRFSPGTPANVVESAINNANAKVKAYITKKMNAITPPELRDSGIAS